MATKLVSFGRDVVTFHRLPADPHATPDSFGVQPRAATSGRVPGCRHRPVVTTASGGAGMARSEYPELGLDVATEYFQTTLPPAPAALAAKSSDTFSVDGDTGGVFTIIAGPDVFNDGVKPFKVTVISFRQTLS